MTPDADAERRFEALLDSVGVGVVVFGLDGKVTSVNLRVREVFNFPSVWQDDISVFDTDLEVLDANGARLAPEDFPAVKTLETGESIANRVIGARAPDQDRITWVLCGARQLRDPDTQMATGVICTLVDISEQRASQEAIRASAERFRLFAENAPDVIYRVGLSPLRFEYINPAVFSILGYTRDEFFRNPQLVFELVHPDDIEATRAHLADLEKASKPLVIRMTRRDGGIIFTEHRIVQVRELGMLVVLEGIVRDVTALKAAEADLNRLALHDSLTGLPNRVQLLGRLDRGSARDRRDSKVLAVLYIDVDRFKVVNDNLGHDVGDELLGVVAHRIEEALRPSDFVARLGGDEFAAVLDELHDEQEGERVAERVLAAVARPLDLGQGEMIATVSIGVAYDEIGLNTSAELLRRSDLAMYSAKDRGRARVERYEGSAAPSSTTDER